MNECSGGINGLEIMITRTCRGKSDSGDWYTLPRNRKEILHRHVHVLSRNACTPSTRCNRVPPGECRLPFGVEGLYLHLRIITEGPAKRSALHLKACWGLSSLRYYCEGAEAPAIAASCGFGEVLGDRAGGRGEVGRPGT